jgi:hypothetical protein
MLKLSVVKASTQFLLNLIIFHDILLIANMFWSRPLGEAKNPTWFFQIPFTKYEDD